MSRYSSKTKVVLQNAVKEPKMPKQISITVDERLEKELISRGWVSDETMEQIIPHIAETALSRFNDSSLCHCGGLEYAAENPNHAVEFDYGTNEFQIVKRIGPCESILRIRFCFYCGGRAPRSMRESLFDYVPSEEHARIAQLFKDIRTIEDAIKLFGQPNQDIPGGDVRKDDSETWSIVSRSIVYTNVSDIADVRLVFSTGGGVELGIQGKPKSRTS
jgi:hypothetical protein